ncbi:MAG: ABC transporter ATP-binding protein [Candidatus Parvarchaeota archaeon]|nr:ABC transporter ATP-binding protein [Candidatus Parvarchaeota archaeon]
MPYMVRVVVKNLSKRYDEKRGKSFALKNVSLDSDIHGIFTIIGRNGAGKTTLIRILSTELLPTSGSVYMAGVDVVKMPSKIRDRIAVVPQEGRLVPWMSVLQNISTYLLWRGFSYKEAVSRARQSIHEFRLDRYADKLPEKLSGGMKRKALVALVMSSEADIIFLDEPSTGLDPVSRRELWSMLKKLKKDRMIVLTTHYLEEAEELSDKIAVLDEGRLVAFGTLDDLRKKVGYPYSIRVLSGKHRLSHVHGKVLRKEDGTMQIFSSEDEADKLASRFIRSGVKFSMNPTSLDDIFYMLVGDINKDEEAADEKEWS